MAAEVGGGDVVALRQTLLREFAKPSAVARDSVQADDARETGLSPLVDMQLHRRPARASTSGGRVARQSPTMPTSAA